MAPHRGPDGVVERAGRYRYECTRCGRERWSSNPQAATTAWVCIGCGTRRRPAGPFEPSR